MSAAAVDVLVKEGFRKIIILAWSLGANISVYYAVNEPHPNVRGLILEGCSSSLPESNKNRLKKWNNRTSRSHHVTISYN